MATYWPLGKVVFGQRRLQRHSPAAFDCDRRSQDLASAIPNSLGKKGSTIIHHRHGGHSYSKIGKLAGYHIIGFTAQISAKHVDMLAAGCLNGSCQKQQKRHRRGWGCHPNLENTAELASDLQ
uniref:Uncharacterized protein n=1 Tax=Eutreptiella gymnastica TaxID=73025 RepID=A0A7S1II89_9EUGL